MPKLKFPKVLYVTFCDDASDDPNSHNMLAWRDKSGLGGCEGQKAAVYELLEVKTVKEFDPELV